MTLLEKVEKSAQRKGKKLNREIKTGLKAIQAMHDIAKKCKGSAYKIYTEKEQ